MAFIPLIITAFFSVALLFCVHWILIGRHPEMGNERMFPRHLVMLGLTVACVVGTALALPVSDSSRNQLIGLIGLVISGIFAFLSSMHLKTLDQLGVSNNRPGINSTTPQLNKIVTARNRG
jgi:high-affinity Fe2+/Pb2+ permease